MLEVHKRILNDHQEALAGRLSLQQIDSKALGIKKAFFTYEPPENANQPSLPLVYAFRGHEREYVYVGEDPSRQISSVQAIDQLIQIGELPPHILVFPGLNSDDNHIPSLGMNMIGLDAIKEHKKGLGQGQFWKYLNTELFPWVESHFGSVISGNRMAFGYSLGGYTVSLLMVLKPAYFKAMGMYDALLMFSDQIDWRTGKEDLVWGKMGIFDGAFGQASKRTINLLQAWNPSKMIAEADQQLAEELKKLRVWIRSTKHDGNRGNIYRNQYFSNILKEKGVVVNDSPISLHENAEHQWYWNDIALQQFLMEMLNHP